MSGPCKKHDQDYTNPQGLTKRAVDRLFFFRLMLEANTWKKKLVARAYYWAVTRGHLSWWLCRWKQRNHDS